MSPTNPYGPPEAGSSVSTEPFTYKPLSSTLALASPWILGGLLVGGVTLPIVLGVFLVPLQVVLIGVAVLRQKRDAHAVRIRLLRAGIWAVTLTGLLVYGIVEQRVARAQAQRIVDACLSYEKDHGQLPHDLDQLVPDYLPRLPRSLGLLPPRSFSYLPPDEKGTASFMYVPEIVARTWYSFDTHQWRTFR